MMRRLYKLAYSLRQRGFVKTSQKVLDLLSKKKEIDLRRERNKKILDQLHQEDKFHSIQQQHQQDLEELKGLSPSRELGLDQPRFEPSTSRRYEVQVRYPSFDDDGRPYFDSSSVEEFLVLTESELEQHRQQEQKGYLKIEDVRKLLPKSRSK